MYAGRCFNGMTCFFFFLHTYIYMQYLLLYFFAYFGGNFLVVFYKR